MFGRTGQRETPKYNRGWSGKSNNKECTVVVMPRLGQDRSEGDRDGGITLEEAIQKRGTMVRWKDGPTML